MSAGLEHPEWGLGWGNVYIGGVTWTRKLLPLDLYHPVWYF